MTLVEFINLTPDERIEKRKRYGYLQRSARQFTKAHKKRYFERTGKEYDHSSYYDLVLPFLGSVSISEFENEAKKSKYSPQLLKDAKTACELLLDYLVSDPEFFFGYYPDTKDSKKEFRPGVLPLLYLNDFEDELSEFLIDGHFKSMTYEQIKEAAEDAGISTTVETISGRIRNWDVEP